MAGKLREIAEYHGWQRESNQDLTRIARYLAVVGGDPTIAPQYRAARSFHTNAFEDEYGTDEFERRCSPGR